MIGRLQALKHIIFTRKYTLFKYDKQIEEKETVFMGLFFIPNWLFFYFSYYFFNSI